MSERPVSYGDAQRAREYVTGLLRARTETGNPGKYIYLTAAPVIASDSGKWTNIIRTLREFIPGIPFRHWPLISKDVPSGTPGERADWIVSHHAGDIVIGEITNHSLKLGLMALLESTKFDAAGKPVLVFTGTRLIAWPDCHVHKIPEGKRRTPHVAASIRLPERPQARPLPTLAASFHVLGISDPDIIARAAGIGTTLSPRFRAPAS